MAPTQANARRPASTLPPLPGLSSLPRQQLKGTPSRLPSGSAAKHVVLPESAQMAPITRPMPSTLRVSKKAEDMTKAERSAAGYARLTTYSTGNTYIMSKLTAFLKREHGVGTVRVYDEAVYTAYTLPLLPGYGGGVRVRSSAPSAAHVDSKDPKSATQRADLVIFDYGVAVFYNFPGANSERRVLRDIIEAAGTERKKTAAAESSKTSNWFGDRWNFSIFRSPTIIALPVDSDSDDDQMEGVDDDEWEVESMHYEYDPDAESPKIANDFFVFKSRSHLLKLSIGHALAQSSKLAAFEREAELSLSSASMIPRDLALSGIISLNRREALHLTGDLFRLRVDVNLVSNILDTPELFWSEGSLKKIYDAAREYFEISERAKALNGRLDVANDLLHIIHDKVSEQEMDRLTWIIIWLILLACIVAIGEVAARVLYHVLRKGAEEVAFLRLRDMALTHVERQTMYSK